MELVNHCVDVTFYMLTTYNGQRVYLSSDIATLYIVYISHFLTLVLLQIVPNICPNVYKIKQNMNNLIITSFIKIYKS